MSIDLLAQLIAVLACGVIVLRGESVINRMSPCTPVVVRLAFWLVTVAAIAALVFIAMGDVPAWPAVIGATGTAALLFCERRLRVLSRAQRRERNDHATTA